MATSTRLRRLRGNADIRNYVFNNAWPNYVPGHSRSQQFLEKKIKKLGNWETAKLSSMDMMPDIAAPWEHPNIRLLQQSFHPVPVWDVEFDDFNRFSNSRGQWPVQIPQLPAKAFIFRKLAVFNDEFSGEAITVYWDLNWKNGAGKPLFSGKIDAVVPCGEHRIFDIGFIAPRKAGPVRLFLRTEKAGEVRYREDKIIFNIVR